MLAIARATKTVADRRISAAIFSICRKSTISACAKKPCSVPQVILDAPIPQPTNLPYMSEEETTDYLQAPPADIDTTVLQKISDKIDSGFKDNFMVCDLGRLRKRYEMWQLHFPRVRPFYAVKCNDDPRILETLASLGSGFDCASWKEINTALSMVEPDDIIFANPCKQQSHLEKAREHNVAMMTFDTRLVP